MSEHESSASTGPDAKSRRVLEIISKALVESQLSAALIGGHARNVWDEPRYTVDFDLTVAADATAISLFRESLEAQGFEVTRLQAPEAASGPDFVQMINPANGDRIELQASKTPFQDLVIERAQPAEGYLIPVATPEDLLILKMIAHRTKDNSDIAILAMHEALDWDYINYWAGVWGVVELAKEVRLRAAEEMQ